MEGSIDVMNFIYEHPDRFENFLSCPDINESGIRRFHSSPVVGSLDNKNVFSITHMPENGIIPTAGSHDPDDWAGWPFIKGTRRDSLFFYLHDKYKERMRRGKALLLIDQTLEGYQTNWLWEFFHSNFAVHDLPPESVIYITGNLKAEEDYQMWCAKHLIPRKLKVISYSHFEKDICKVAQDMLLNGNFKEKIDYKSLHNIKTYNCLQKRTRAHRSWFYLYLFKAGLLGQGLVSSNDYNGHIPDIEGQSIPKELLIEGAKLLPLTINDTPNNDRDDQHYIRRILDQVCLDTWVSVVSEASFADSDNTIFISEKMFKPIACMHPFIVVGNKGSLTKLKEMGYKTFEGFIDESYDQLPTFERFDAIIESIKKIDAIEDKMAWYKSMEDILTHNYNVLMTSTKRVPLAIQELQKYYNEYFKL
jgi:hypothetical protein